MSEKNNSPTPPGEAGAVAPGKTGRNDPDYKACVDIAFRFSVAAISTGGFLGLVYAVEDGDAAYHGYTYDAYTVARP